MKITLERAWSNTWRFHCEHPNGHAAGSVLFDHIRTNALQTALYGHTEDQYNLIETWGNRAGFMLAWNRDRIVVEGKDPNAPATRFRRRER